MIAPTTIAHLITLFSRKILKPFLLTWELLPETFMEYLPYLFAELVYTISFILYIKILFVIVISVC